MSLEDNVRLAIVERNLKEAPDLRARYVAALISRTASWLRRRVRPSNDTGEASTDKVAASSGIR